MALTPDEENLLIECDSLLSLIKHRESVGMLKQTKADIDQVLRKLRPRTEAIVVARRHATSAHG